MQNQTGYILRKLTILTILLLTFFAAVAQNDCNEIASYATHQEWIYQWYGSNEKPSYTSYHKVISPAHSDRSQIAVTIINAYGDNVYQGDYFVRCTDIGLYQDLLSKLTPDMLQSLNGLTIKTGEHGWILPHGLKAGDYIPQSYSHIAGFNDGTKIIDLDIAIGPVNIHEREDLTTPAGGFPCVTMSYELWITQMIRKRFRLRDWFAPGVGIIRREIFDRKGQFYGYCELVEFNTL